MKPKSHKDFKDGIAEEVGVHKNVVDDFINFYYEKLRKSLSSLEYHKIMVDGLGTFSIRKNKLEKEIKRYKSILGNITKTTYNGYEKSVIVKEKLEEMERVAESYNQMVKEKKEFKGWGGNNT